MLSHATKSVELLASVKSYNLPPIPCSLPLKCHPHFSSLSRLADTWAINAMQLKDPLSIAKLVQSRVPLALCFIIPEGTGEAEMIASCKYIWSTSFIDDPFDQETEVDRAVEWKGVVLRAAEGHATAAELEASTTMQAYTEIMGELRQMMAPRGLFPRFMRAHYAWADQCVELVRRKQFKDPPTVGVYLQHRCDNLLMEAIYILGELCMGVHLPEEFLTCLEFRSILRTMLEHVAMVNDIMSIPTDITNDHYYALPGLLFLTDPNIQEFQQAVDQVCLMIQEKEKEFIRLHEILTTKAKRMRKKSLLKYAQALPYYISGNWYWHYLSARYHGVDNPCVTGEPFSGIIHITPEKSFLPRLCQAKTHGCLLDVDNLAAQS